MFCALRVWLDFGSAELQGAYVNYSFSLQKVAQLSIRDRAAGWVSWPKLKDCNYTVFQKKWRQNSNRYLRHILSELIILLAALIIAFLAQTLQISTKSTTWFLSNSFFKKWNLKTEFSNMENTD